MATQATKLKSLQEDIRETAVEIAELITPSKDVPRGAFLPMYEVEAILFEFSQRVRATTNPVREWPSPA